MSDQHSDLLAELRADYRRQMSDLVAELRHRQEEALRNKRRAQTCLLVCWLAVVAYGEFLLLRGWPT